MIEYLEAKVCCGQQNGSQLKQTRDEANFFYKMMKTPSPNGLSNRDNYKQLGARIVSFLGVKYTVDTGCTKNCSITG